MAGYVLNLVLMLLLVAGMAVASLWFWRRMQPGMALRQADKLVRVVDAVPMGPTARLAVVEFEGRRILLSVTRGRIDKLAEAEMEGGLIDDGPPPAPANPFERMLRRP